MTKHLFQLNAWVDILKTSYNQSFEINITKLIIKFCTSF